MIGVEQVAKASRKSQAGRPPLSGGGSTRLTVRIPDGIVARVDEIITERGGVTDRGTVLRELVVDGLKAQKRWK